MFQWVYRQHKFDLSFFFLLFKGGLWKHILRTCLCFGETEVTWLVFSEFSHNHSQFSPVTLILRPSPTEATLISLGNVKESVSSIAFPFMVYTHWEVDISKKYRIYMFQLTDPKEVINKEGPVEDAWTPLRKGIKIVIAGTGKEGHGWEREERR